MKCEYGAASTDEGVGKRYRRGCSNLTGAPGEGGGRLAVGEEEQQLHLAIVVRGGGWAEEALEMGVEVGERRVHLLHRHGNFSFSPDPGFSSSEVDRGRRKKTAADFLSLHGLRERVPLTLHGGTGPVTLRGTYASLQWA
jgi:hypothetical protein